MTLCSVLICVRKEWQWKLEDMAQLWGAYTRRAFVDAALGAEAILRILKKAIEFIELIRRHALSFV